VLAPKLTLRTTEAIGGFGDATCMLLACHASNYFGFATQPGYWQVGARYVGTGEEIAKGNAEGEIIGPPGIRDVDPDSRYFTPFRITPHANSNRRAASEP